MIVLVGAAHLDRLGQTDAPAKAESSNPGSFRNTVGGAALNVASTLAALDCEVLLISCVGDDATGRDVRAELAQRGVNTEITTLPDQRTATYTAIVNNDGDLVIGLADMEVYNHFPAHAATRTIQKLEAEDWLLIDANLPEDLIATLVDTAPCKIAAMTVSSAKAKRLSIVLDKIDLLFTNRTEVSALLGLPDTSSPHELVTGMNTQGVKAVVMTNGADDLHVLNGNTFDVIPISPVAASDVTGAGDALTAGCLYEVMAAKPLKQAVKTGISAAKAVLQVSGPYLTEMKTILANTKDH